MFSKRYLTKPKLIYFINRTVYFLIIRFYIVIIILLLMTFLFLQKNNHPIYLSTREFLVSSTLPIIGIFDNTANSMVETYDKIKNFFQLYNENDKLRKDLANIRHYQVMYETLLSENKNLREQLNYLDGKEYEFLTARIYINSNSPFKRAVIIGAGSLDGIFKNQVVLHKGALLGRVIQVNNHNAEILLINDIGFKVPVISIDSRERAILSGNSSYLADLHYLKDDHKLADKEKIISSGDGDFIPYGLPVGIVQQTKNNQFQVKPFANINEIEYVTILKK